MFELEVFTKINCEIISSVAFQAAIIRVQSENPLEVKMFPISGGLFLSWAGCVFWNSSQSVSVCSVIEP